MTFPPIFADIRKRPEMYLPAATYEAAVSFVAGYNAAFDGGLLIGFREWLITQLNEGNNLAWSELVLDSLQQRALGSVTGEKPSTEAAHRAALEGLFNTLEAFFQERSQYDGARRIFAAYEGWLQKQEWYKPSSPQWIPPSR
jgi:hypothetical protein